MAKTSNRRTRETNSELKILEQRWQWQKNPLPEEFLYEEEWKNLLAEEGLLI